MEIQCKVEVDGWLRQVRMHVSNFILVRNSQVNRVYFIESVSTCYQHEIMIGYFRPQNDPSRKARQIRDLEAQQSAS